MEKNHQYFLNQARDRIGLPRVVRRNTKKQTLFFERSKLIDIFKEAVNQEHGSSYFIHSLDEADAKKANSAIGKMIKEFYERCDRDLEKAKAVVEWFSKSNYFRATENNYSPTVCFSKKTIVDFENKDIKLRAGGNYESNQNEEEQHYG